MTQSDINEKSGLPNEVSLGDVLGDLMLTTGEVLDLINVWRTQLDDHGSLAIKMRDHAIKINDPATYANANSDEPTGFEPNVMRTAGFVAPAAQGQATTYGTIGTPGLATPSANQPTVRPSTPLSGDEREELQRLREQFGTTDKQPGYVPPSTLTTQETAATTAPSYQPSSSQRTQAQHWDDGRKVWVYNDTNEPVENASQRSEQSTYDPNVPSV